VAPVCIDRIEKTDCYKLLKPNLNRLQIILKFSLEKLNSEDMKKTVSC